VVDRLLLVVALVAVAVVVAWVIQRRRPDPPTQQRWTVPSQLDRDDFEHPGAEWLVVVFSSASCTSCADVVAKAESMASDSVAVQDAEVAERADLHERYGIDAVPTVVVADAEGVVRASFIGPVTAADLWATVADLREPGSVPPGCDHGVPSNEADGSGA
jgi:hypothetical protein